MDASLALALAHCGADRHEAMRHDSEQLACRVVDDDKDSTLALALAFCGAGRHEALRLQQHPIFVGDDGKDSSLALALALCGAGLSLIHI